VAVAEPRGHGGKRRRHFASTISHNNGISHYVCPVSRFGSACPSDNSRDVPSPRPCRPRALCRLLKVLPETHTVRPRVSSDAVTGKLHRRDNGHVIVITGRRRLGNSSDLDMIVVSPLAEVIEEVRQQRRGSVVNDAISLSTTQRPLVIIGAVQASYLEHRYLMTPHYTTRRFYYSGCFCLLQLGTRLKS